jgi:hypothetical protein
VSDTGEWCLPARAPASSGSRLHTPESLDAVTMTDRAACAAGPPSPSRERQPRAAQRRRPPESRLHPASMTQDSSCATLLKMELVEAIQTGADAFERFCTLLNT